MVLTESTSLPLGWPAEDFELPDTEGNDRSLSEFTNRKGLMIVFTCNHCPYAQAAWPLLIRLYDKYANNVNFVAINPNDSENYPDDSLEKMQKLVEEKMIPFPYLRDDDQGSALAYQAQCTPDIYLFKIENKKPNLFYHGRINDNWKDEASVKERNLEDALENLVNDQEPPDQQPPSMGCSIKWIET